MRVFLAAAMLFAASPLAVAQAQDKPTDGQSAAPSAWTKERIESPPKREIRFERATEVRKKRLTRADVKLLEMKYTATVKVMVRSGGGWESNASEKLKSPAFYRWLNLFLQSSLDITAQPISDDKVVALHDSFQAAIDAMPVDERPPQAVIDYFTSEHIGARLVPAGRWEAPNYVGSRRGTREFILAFDLLATSPEQAEQVASGLLKIFDWGVCRTIQQDIWIHRDEAEKTVAASRQRMDEYTKTIAPLAEEVAQLGTFSSPEAQAGLMTLNLQLLVEQTGIKARIQACDKLMVRAGLAAARREKLEDERLEAEVELASVEARLKALQATTGMAKEQRSLRSRESWLRTLDAYLSQYTPPTLVDESVVIQPIEWQ